MGKGGNGSSSSEEEERTSYDEGGGDFVMVLARGIYNMRFFFVVAWPILAAVMAPLSWLCVQNAAPIVKQPPRNTESTEALGVFEHHFEDLATIRKEMVEIRCRFPCTSAVSDYSHGLVEQIEDLVKRFSHDHPGTVAQVSSYFTFHGHHQLGKNPMISQDHQAILVQWLWRMTPDKKAAAEAFIGRMGDLVAQINHFQGPDGYDVSLSGLMSLDHAMKETLIEEIPVHEISTIWMPFIILACALQSVRLLLLALIPMPIEILVAIGAMYFVSLHTTVLFYALMMMLMLCTSLSFDYALFTLTRYSEERGNGAEVKEAILTVISQSGRVVVVSGCVLMIAWGAMLALPNPFKSFCVCANGMILTCVLVQLTFTPSLLAILPFLGPPASKPKARKVVPEALEEADSPLTRPSDKSLGHENALEKAKPHMSGIGFAMGRWLTLFPLNIIIPIIVYVVMMPLTQRMGQNFTLSTFKFRMGHSYALTVPRTRDEWHTALRVQRDFPNSVGILMPMLIIATNSLPQADLPHMPNMTELGADDDLGAESSQYTTMTTPKPVDVRGQRFFDANCHMADDLIQATSNTAYNLSANNFVGISFQGENSNGGVDCLNSEIINQVRTNFLFTDLFLQHTSQNLKMLWDQVVSKGNHAMLTFIFPTMDPFSPSAFELVKVTRRVLRQLTLQGKEESSPIPGLTFMTFSPASILMDLIEVTSVRLPIAFVGCVLVCLVLIAAWFGAIFIPLKLLLTVVVPITWTYGAALYVYEDGVLEFTGFPGVMRTGDAGIDWTVPMFTLTFIVGLALDYEIFLIERIREFREEGFGDRESIQLGLAATSGTITCAGLIMALTFIAQMLGSIPVTNQMGFILVFSIVTDTFIVRTVLVPAMLSLVPCANYWPSKMPPVRYEWLAKGLPAPIDTRTLDQDMDWDEDDMSDSD